MKDFAYIRATSLEQAVTLLAESGTRSRILAGGTDLIIQLRQNKVELDRVVDVTHVPELKVIQVNGRITVGAAVTFTEILNSPILQQTAPLLIQACRDIGSVQIRNTATLGGNVANASAAADSVPALVCLGAEAIVVSAQGERRVSVSELIPRASHPRLEPEALIQAFIFDRPPQESRAAFERVIRRQAVGIARLSLAAMGALNLHGEIALMRLVPGAALACFKRITPVEEMLVGRKPSDELFAAAGRCMAEQYVNETGRRWSTEYKEPALAAITERALRRVVGGQGEA